MMMIMIKTKGKEEMQKDREQEIYLIW
jgi:hypothetical protein